MAYKVKALIPNYVLMVEVDGFLQARDAESMNNEIHQYMDASPAETMHLVVMAGKMQGLLGSNIAQYRKMMTFLRDERIGWVVVAGDADPWVKFIQTVIANAFKLHLHRVSTFDEALVYLFNIQPELQSMYESHISPWA
jgi:hypothetical protein